MVSHSEIASSTPTPTLSPSGRKLTKPLMTRSAVMALGRCSMTRVIFWTLPLVRRAGAEDEESGCGARAPRGERPCFLSLGMDGVADRWVRQACGCNTESGSTRMDYSMPRYFGRASEPRGKRCTPRPDARPKPCQGARCLPLSRSANAYLATNAYLLAGVAAIRV
jgi:hypothetical protein